MCNSKTKATGTPVAVAAHTAAAAVATAVTKHIVSYMYYMVWASSVNNSLIQNNTHIHTMK